MLGIRCLSQKRWKALKPELYTDLVDGAMQRLSYSATISIRVASMRQGWELDEGLLQEANGV